MEKVICGGIIIHEFMCQNCQHYINVNSCAAFPNGIPRNIRFGWVKHISPIEGDNGITFQWREDIEPYSFDDLLESND